MARKKRQSKPKPQREDRASKLRLLLDAGQEAKADGRGELRGIFEEALTKDLGRYQLLGDALAPVADAPESIRLRTWPLLLCVISQRHVSSPGPRRNQHEVRLISAMP